MANNVVDFVNSTPYPMIIGGDWNFNVNDDPYGISSDTGLRQRGRGIDGFYYSENVFEFSAIYALKGLDVNSDHDPVQIVVDVQPLAAVADWQLYDPLTQASTSSIRKEHP